MLKDIEMLSLTTLNRSNVEHQVNNLYDKLCNAIHSAAKTCHKENTHKSKSKSKKWWIKNCLKARNHNRLFFQIWKYKLMNKLYFMNNSKKLWNMIKRSKKNNMSDNVVNIETFKNYFS